MFIAGMSKITEPPENDIWTVPGEEGLPVEWKKADLDLFRKIDATEYFHTLQFRDFAQAILQDRNPAVDGREGRKTVALIEAIYRSGREKRAITLS